MQKRQFESVSVSVSVFFNTLTNAIPTLSLQCSTLKYFKIFLVIIRYRKSFFDRYEQILPSTVGKMKRVIIVYFNSFNLLY